MIHISRQQNRIEINLAAYDMGQDICVIITGGDTPHLGALTVGSENHENQTFAFDSHKEFAVTELFGDRLRGAFEGNFAICCGIHLDQITKSEISVVMDLCRDMAEELIKALEKRKSERSVT
jgi:gallate decarboxylase subunit D